MRLGASLLEDKHRQMYGPVRTKATVMTYELKQKDYIKAWAIFWVICTVGSMIIGAMAGMTVGFVLGGFGVKMHAIKIVCGILAFLLGIPLSFVTYQYSIRTFLLPKLPAAPQGEALKLAA